MRSIKVIFVISLYQLFNDDVQTLHIPFKLDPDLTRAYFWPAVNKRPTQLWRGYFLIQPKNIFLTRRAKNWEIRDSGENFQTQTKDGWPNPSSKNLTWPNPSQKFFTLTHHYFKLILRLAATWSSTRAHTFSAKSILDPLTSYSVTGWSPLLISSVIQLTSI